MSSPLVALFRLLSSSSLKKKKKTPLSFIFASDCAEEGYLCPFILPSFFFIFFLKSLAFIFTSDCAKEGILHPYFLLLYLSCVVSLFTSSGKVHSSSLNE